MSDHGIEAFYRFPLWFRRTTVVVAFIPVMLWTISVRIVREIKPIPLYLRSDISEEIAVARNMWRRTPVR